MAGNPETGAGTHAASRAGGSAGGAETMLRIALVRLADERATIQDCLDIADLAHELGRAEVARMLFAVAFLRRGFDPASVREQRRITAETGLADVARWPQDDRGGTASGVGIAVALEELGRLMALDLPRLEPPTIVPPSATEVTPPALNLVELDVPTFERGAVLALAEQLCDALRNSDVPALERLLDQAGDHVASLAPIPLTGFMGDPLEQLAAALTLDQLRRFFLRHHDLCWAPFGAAGLLAATARLRPGALGPYLAAVQHLIRTPRDLFGLVEKVGGARRRDDVERWIVLLSTHLDDDTRVLVTDELGDRGMIGALAGMLRQAMRGGDAASYFPRAIRDAALDLGEIALAARAQAFIAQGDRTNVDEWVMLGEILGSAGLDQAAEVALIHACRIAPADDEATPARLAALRERRFDAYRVLAGFASPPWRVALRARYRSDAETARSPS